MIKIETTTEWANMVMDVHGSSVEFDTDETNMHCLIARDEMHRQVAYYDAEFHVGEVCPEPLR